MAIGSHAILYIPYTDHVPARDRPLFLSNLLAQLTENTCFARSDCFSVQGVIDFVYGSHPTAEIFCPCKNQLTVDIGSDCGFEL